MAVLLVVVTEPNCAICSVVLELTLRVHSAQRFESSAAGAILSKGGECAMKSEIWLHLDPDRLI